MNSLDEFLGRLTGKQLAAARRSIRLYLLQRTKSRLSTQQTADGAGFAPRHGRGGKMLKGFARRTRTQMSFEGAEIGYRGRDGRLARVHNMGLRDRITTQSGRSVMADYPARQWLGINADDQTRIMQILHAQLEGGNA